MQFKKPLSCAALALMALTSVAEARSLRGDGVPAEVPPESFTGNQYIDSRGCVFIRAGVDGATNWIPRVTRDRKLVCGFQPTNTGGSTAVAAVDEPELIELTPTTPTTTTQTVATTTASVAAPAPRKTTVRPKPVVLPSLTPRTAAPVLAAPAQPVATQVTGGCSNMPAQSRKYLQHSSSNVRCGSQAQAIRGGLGAPSAGYQMPGYQDHDGTMVVANGAVSGQPAAPGSVAPGTHIIPKHLYQSHQYAVHSGEPPEGYRHTWTDDRLNPYRGVQTFEGQQAMAQVWDTSKPLMKAPKYKAPAANYSVSTRGAPAGNTMVLTPNTYVQVAAYGSADDAQRVAQRVRKLGVPVRIGRMSQGYGEVRLVLMGPFYNSHDAQNALSKARSAGYANAYIR